MITRDGRPRGRPKLRWIEEVEKKLQELGITKWKNTVTEKNGEISQERYSYMKLKSRGLSTLS